MTHNGTGTLEGTLEAMPWNGFNVVAVAEPMRSQRREEKRQQVPLIVRSCWREGGRFSERFAVTPYRLPPVYQALCTVVQTFIFSASHNSLVR